jgi:GAF domain-containing protein
VTENEELIVRTPSGTVGGQTALVQDFCRLAGEQIQAARSIEEARDIAEKACADFSAECGSEVLKRTLRSLLHDRIDKRWHEHHDHH